MASAMKPLALFLLLLLSNISFAFHSVGFDHNVELFSRGLGSKSNLLDVGPLLSHLVRRGKRKTRPSGGYQQGTSQTQSIPASSDTERERFTTGRQMPSEQESVDAFKENPSGRLSETGARVINLPGNTEHGQHAIHVVKEGLSEPGKPHTVRPSGFHTFVSQ